MDLRTNYTTMLDLIALGSENLTQAKQKLAIHIVAAQKEIKTVVEQSAKYPSAADAHYLSFSSDYTDLFVNTFYTVASAMNKILSTGTALPDEEFDAIDVGKIGVKQVPITSARWTLYAEVDGTIISNPYLNPFTCIMYSNTDTYEGYSKWTFPEKFYFDSEDGGEDYGKLYVYNPDKSIGPFGPEWYVDEIKSWGPFAYGRTWTSDHIPYSELLTYFAGWYGRAEYNRDAKGAYAIWPEWNPPLDNMLSTKSSRTACPLINWSEENQAKILKDAMISHVVFPAASIPPEDLITYKWGTTAHGDWALGGSRLRTSDILPNYINLGIVDQGTTEYVYDLDIESNSYGSRYQIIKNIKINSVGARRGITDKVTIPIDLSYLKTYDITDLIEGDFGSKPISTGLNGQLIKQVNMDTCTCSANQLLGVIYTDTSSIVNPLDISDKINSYSALVQMANLFAVKYALERILYGHIIRVTK